jgi:AraC-like DNA-binding protein
VTVVPAGPRTQLPLELLSAEAERDEPGSSPGALHASPQHRWTTAKLANEIGMSRVALSARFTKLVGKPPMAYLCGWCMTLAADSLPDTDATVADVAHNVGYDNAFAFGTAFKRTYGHSPTTWRRIPDRTDAEPLGSGNGRHSR